MKKIVLLFIIVGIVLVAGCVGEQKTSDIKATANIQTEQHIDSQANKNLSANFLDNLIKPSDVPGFTMNSREFFAVPENSDFSMAAQLAGKNFVSNYIDPLPKGKRNVGVKSSWDNNAGRGFTISIIKFDSNDGFKEYFDQLIRDCNENIKKFRPDGCGSVNVGDYSIFRTEDRPEAMHTNVMFSHRNYLMQVGVYLNKDISYDEALRIAKIIESRLN